MFFTEQQLAHVWCLSLPRYFLEINSKNVTARLNIMHIFWLLKTLSSDPPKCHTASPVRPSPAKHETAFPVLWVSSPLRAKRTVLAMEETLHLSALFCIALAHVLYLFFYRGDHLSYHLMLFLLI